MQQRRIEGVKRQKVVTSQHISVELWAQRYWYFTTQFTYKRRYEVLLYFAFCAITWLFFFSILRFSLFFHFFFYSFFFSFGFSFVLFYCFLFFCWHITICFDLLNLFFFAVLKFRLRHASTKKIVLMFQFVFHNSVSYNPFRECVGQSVSVCFSFISRSQRNRRLWRPVFWLIEKHV